MSVSISFQGLDHSDALENYITEQFEGLTKYFDRISGCSVVVSTPHRHHKNRTFHVHIHLEVPGNDLHVNREPEKNDQHTDPKLAVRDAFQKMATQLKKYREKQKAH